jgi:phospholipase/carboxylesterase
MEEEKNNEPYLSASIKIVKDLLDTIASHIPKSQIYLMGFSQGACLSLEIATRFATQYAGVVAFSGGLIGSILDEKKYHGDFNGTKVFIGISEQDPHVPLMRVEESAQLMRNLNANVTVMSYQGTAHTINDDEIHWVKENMFSL